MKLLPALALLPCLSLAAPAGELTDLSPQIAAILKDSSVPSLSVAAVVDGEITAIGAAGIRKLGSPEKVTAADRYHLGSCTKSMTATLAAILVREKQITWDTTVSDVFKTRTIHPDQRKTTLRQLLTNTGGMPKDIEPELWAELWKATGSPASQRRKLVKGMLAKAPEYPSGTGYEYSNAGFAIAGAMLETAAGKPYETLLREQLFIPLGMHSAGFRAPATNGKTDQPYGHHLENGKLTPVDPEPAGDNPRAIAPAGAVHASALDFAKYASFHLGAGARGLLTAKQREPLYQPPAGNDYAMGWVVTERPWANGTALRHVGTNTMFHAVIWIAPARDFAAVALCNDGRPDGFQICDKAISMIIRKYLK